MFQLSHNAPTQVHLLTAHVDELTAHVTTPLDTLVSIALEASKTELAKGHLMSQFKAKARRMRRQMECLREVFDKEVKGKVGERQQAVDNADRAITFLTKLSPHVVGAARALSSKCVWYGAGRVGELGGGDARRHGCRCVSTHSVLTEV